MENYQLNFVIPIPILQIELQNCNIGWAIAKLEL
jgi:hypothetical protein